MTTKSLIEGQQVRLLTMPNGCTAGKLPLTVGNTYTFHHYDGSNVVTTTDEVGLDGHYWHGHVEAVLPKN